MVFAVASLSLIVILLFPNKPPSFFLLVKIFCWSNKYTEARGDSALCHRAGWA